MTFDALNKSLRAARMQRNGVFLAALMLLVLNVMLVGTLSSTTRTTVLVPSRVSDGMVAAGAVDRRFMEALALDAVYAFYNSSPETAQYGRQVVERLSSVRDRPELLEAYDRNASDMRQRRITTTFFVARVEHDPNTLTVRIAGRLQTFIETKVVDAAERTVVVRFQEEASSVRVAEMYVEEAAS